MCPSHTDLNSPEHIKRYGQTWGLMVSHLLRNRLSGTRVVAEFFAFVFKLSFNTDNFYNISDRGKPFTPAWLTRGRNYFWWTLTYLLCWLMGLGDLVVNAGCAWVGILELGFQASSCILGSSYTRSQLAMIAHPSTYFLKNPIQGYPRRMLHLLSYKPINVRKLTWNLSLGNVTG